MSQDARSPGAAEIFDAVEAGDASRVRELLAEDPGLAGATSPEGLSALLWARYLARTEIAELLRDAKGELDLFEAAALGDAARVEALLEEDPGLLDSRSPDGWTPLHLAAHFGHEEVVRLLLELGAEVDVRSRNVMANTPLHAAAGRHPPVCEILVEAGADVNARQEGGWTPLHAAARSGHAETVELLLSRGADPSLTNDDDESAALTAERSGYPDLAARIQEAREERE